MYPALPTSLEFGGGAEVMAGRARLPTAPTSTSGNASGLSSLSTEGAEDRRNMFRARATESPLRVTTPTSDLSRQNSDHYRRPGQRSKTWTVGGTQRRPKGGAGVHPSDHPISKTISLALSATSSRCRRELGAARTRGYSANRRVGACPSELALHYSCGSE